VRRVSKVSGEALTRDPSLDQTRQRTRPRGFLPRRRNRSPTEERAARSGKGSEQGGNHQRHDGLRDRLVGSEHGGKLQHHRQEHDAAHHEAMSQRGMRCSAPGHETADQGRHGPGQAERDADVWIGEAGRTRTEQMRPDQPADEEIQYAGNEGSEGDSGDAQATSQRQQR